MSKESEFHSTETNKEIIDNLTKDLETQCLKADSEGGKDYHDVNIPDKSDAIPEESDESEDEKISAEIPSDYVDEDLLKDVDSTLTNEQKEINKSDALELKTQGNLEFKNGDYLKSIETYTKALKLCPLQYENDRAILYSNRAASKIQLKRNQTAIDDCTKAIELNPQFIRAFLRRAKLYEEIDKLDESLEDWKKILELDAGNTEARTASIRLPPLINERNEKLKTEMLGKLKDLGNMILRPFGLSTENFQLQQDPNTGGYSINFQQNASRN